MADLSQLNMMEGGFKASNHSLNSMAIEHRCKSGGRSTDARTGGVINWKKEEGDHQKSTI
jgi:hypothetical protein